MLVKAIRNYSDGLERKYEVPEDFVEKVSKYALPPTKRPEWWLVAGDEFIGFDIDPTWYYEMICRGIL